MDVLPRARVLLADDHAENRRLLSNLLQAEFDVVAEAADGLALVSAAGRLTADAIVTDISLPLLDGMTAAAAILASDPAARIVFVTMHTDAALVARGFAIGAMGYVWKGEAANDLVVAVRAALRGQRHVSRILRGPNGLDA